MTPLESWLEAVEARAKAAKEAWDAYPTPGKDSTLEGLDIQRKLDAIALPPDVVLTLLEVARVAVPAVEGCIEAIEVIQGAHPEGSLLWETKLQPYYDALARLTELAEREGR